MLRSIIPALAVALLFAAEPASVFAQSSTPGGRNPQASAPAAVVLSTGDAVRITVWRKPELSGEFQIGADGNIADPFYMEIRAAGLPFATVADQVRTHLLRYENEPRVLVEPLIRVSVGGEVRQPNIHTVGPATTVAQAVMLAGGATERARLSKVRLVRDGSVSNVNLSDPQNALARTPIRSGDQITVTRSTNIVRDYVAPISSILGAVVSVAYVVTRYF